jgi:hypothetical protein
MEKIQHLSPVPIQISGHKVVITDQIFNQIINILNTQSSTINTLIDKLESQDNLNASLDSKITNLSQNIIKTNNLIQNLAKAIETLGEN